MQKPLISLLLLFVCGIAYAKYSVKIELDKVDGIYKAGETVKGTVKVFEDGKPVKEFKGKYHIAFERQEMEAKEISSNDKPLALEGKSERPGWLYFRFELLSVNGKTVDNGKKKIAGEAGAMFDPDKIIAAGKPPADFTEYWKKRRQELDRIPVNAKLEPLEVPEKYKNDVKCFAVTVPCLGCAPVTGYLAVPADARPESLVALVDFLSLVWKDAGRERALASAKRGILSFFITWHGLPVNQPESFYLDKGRTDLRGCFLRDADNRDTWFCRDMFLRVMRALDYIKTRPEWNRKDLVARGGSLGGAQSLAAAALDPAVSLAIVSIPAFCDFRGMECGRQPGLPFSTVGKKLLKDNPRVRETAAYCDAVNLAGMIRCEIYVGTGFIDNTCFPSNVFAFYNAIPETTVKRMSTNPYIGHNCVVNTGARQRLRELFGNKIPIW
ncbi:MAG: acetylxylan esterase [Victivallales bacterium]|nr:acetylxylan esterase [Victivallales bacterium]